MPPKPKLRNWNDVQIMLATISIAATLGLWNVFAEPVKTVTAQVQDEPVTPPPPTTEPSPVAAEPTAMPQILPQTKIMFTQVAPQTSNVVQPQKKKKKKNNNNNNGGGGGGGGAVTNTKSS
jgi:hypothetical protein